MPAIDHELIQSLTEVDAPKSRGACWKTGQWHTVAKAEEEEKKKKLWSVKSRVLSFYWADSHSPPPSQSPNGVCASVLYLHNAVKRGTRWAAAQRG